MSKTPTFKVTCDPTLPIGKQTRIVDLSTGEDISHLVTGVRFEHDASGLPALTLELFYSAAEIEILNAKADMSPKGFDPDASVQDVSSLADFVTRYRNRPPE